MDFSKMDGYEFESFISAMLRYMGFSVEETPYSNDGGVDIIAIWEKPIFSGKYMIQCKNWQGLVGAPEVRDLYGVVMDQRANKGILITTSDFTPQAYAFAEGKNIELLNGIALQKLIDSDNSKNRTSDLDDIPNDFNQKRFLYLKKHIETGPRESKYYSEMTDFLREYIVDKENDTLSTKILNLLVKYTETSIKKCFNTKSQKIHRQAEELNSAMYFSLLGHLDKALDIVLNNGMFIRYTSNVGSNFMGLNEVKASWGNDFLTRNLYVIFSYIGYDRGMTIIENLHPQICDSGYYILNNISQAKLAILNQYRLWEGSSNIYMLKYCVKNSLLRNNMLVQISGGAADLSDAMEQIPVRLVCKNILDQDKTRNFTKLDEVFIKHGIL